MMKDYSYTVADYDLNRCVAGIERWMTAMVNEISTGKVRVNSIHINKRPTINIYFPEKWFLEINYSEKEA